MSLESFFTRRKLVIGATLLSVGGIFLGGSVYLSEPAEAAQEDDDISVFVEGMGAQQELADDGTYKVVPRAFGSGFFGDSSLTIEEMINNIGSENIFFDFDTFGVGENNISLGSELGNEDFGQIVNPGIEDNYLTSFFDSQNSVNSPTALTEINISGIVQNGEDIILRYGEDDPRPVIVIETGDGHFDYYNGWQPWVKWFKSTVDTHNSGINLVYSSDIVGEDDCIDIEVLWGNAGFDDGVPFSDNSATVTTCELPDPTATPVPTATFTQTPTVPPTSTLIPTEVPTEVPTATNTATPVPTATKEIPPKEDFFVYLPTISR